MRNGNEILMFVKLLLFRLSSCSECALHTPYDTAHAQKDYEAILAALTQVQKNFEEKDILNISPADKLNSDKTEPAVLALLEKAVEQKSTVDSEFGKIAAAAAVAKSRASE